MIIKIDSEFEKRIPKLRKEELDLLERSLLADGCLEPLTTWLRGGDDYIIDGHNRFRLCEKLGVTFTVNRVEFENKDEALLWIDRHQLGRRNLNDTQRTVIANRVAEHLIAINKKAPRVCLDASSKQKNTREDIAHEANVPVRKMREVQEVVRAKPELEERLLSGEVSLIAARKEVRAEQLPKRARVVATTAGVLPDDVALAWGTLFYLTDHKTPCRNLTLLIDIMENLQREIGSQRLVEYANQCWKRFLTPKASDHVVSDVVSRYSPNTVLRMSNLHKQISRAHGDPDKRNRLIKKLLKAPSPLHLPAAFPGLAFPHMVTEKELRGLKGKRR
jgi:hypothetical protein